jgi:hypothetical protein
MPPILRSMSSELFGFFIAENAKPLMFVFWFVILIGSGYKLFFAQAQNK